MSETPTTTIEPGRSVRIKRAPSRKAEWGTIARIQEPDEKNKVRIFWVQRGTTGGEIPLPRSAFVLKQKPHEIRTAWVAASGKVTQRGLVTRRNGGGAE